MAKLFKLRAALQLVAAVAVSSGLSAASAAPVKQAPAVTAFEAMMERAKQGDANEQNNLGIMYYDGRGVAQDYAAAVSWYLKAAKQGYASAQYNLGIMYYLGRGVAQDYAAAVSWNRKAAEQGYATAQYNLGFMYENGTGVAQDYVQAHKWYNLAGAGAKDAEMRDRASKNRDIVAAKMQPAQIAEAQRLASAWRKK